MTNMSIGAALLLILAIDGMLYLGQVAVHNINPDATLSFISGSSLSDYKSGNTTIDQSNTLSKLPSGKPSLSPGDGNLFIDTFTALWNWFGDIPGLSTIFKVLGGPTAYVTVLAPEAPEFVFVVGAIWYGTTFFLFVAFLLNRGGMQ